MQKTVSWLELARIPRSGRGWLEVFGVIEPQFLNLLLSDFLRTQDPKTGWTRFFCYQLGGWVDAKIFLSPSLSLCLRRWSLARFVWRGVFGRRTNMRSSRDWLSIYFKDVLPWA